MSVLTYIECLFGFHKFDEDWEVIDDIFNPMHLFICTVCRKYGANQPTNHHEFLIVVEIIEETPEYFLIQFHTTFLEFGIRKYLKRVDNTLVECIDYEG